jgi:gluconolactonase
MRFLTTSALAALTCGSSALCGLPPTVPANAVVTKIATLPTESWTVNGSPFTEGATRDPATGDVYFVDQNSNKILKYSVDGVLSTFMHPAGYSNGMSFDRFGKLIACADERNELWEISTNVTEVVPYPEPLNPAVGAPSPGGDIELPEYKVIMDGEYNGGLLNGPNDVWAMPDNSLFFTDPFWSRSWWSPGRVQEQDTWTVYRLSADRQTLTRALAKFATTDGKTGQGSPNGIIASVDGKTLYVAHGPGGPGAEAFAYDVAADGTLSNGRLFAKFASDGMTMDNQGNMYMTTPGNTNPGGQGGVTVVNIASGQSIGFIPVPEGTSNVAFGGVDQSTLYITAGSGFYSIPTKVKGAHLVK